MGAKPILGALVIAVAAAGLCIAKPYDKAPTPAPEPISSAFEAPDLETAEAERRADAAAREAMHEAGRVRAERARLSWLKAARPASAAMAPDHVRGADLRNLRDQKLGSVADVVMREGKIVTAILVRRAPLGIGTEYVAIAWTRVRLAPDGKTLVADITEDAAKALPRVEHRGGHWQFLGAAGKKRS
jgi:hypothetical protein